MSFHKWRFTTTLRLGYYYGFMLFWLLAEQMSHELESYMQVDKCPYLPWPCPEKKSKFYLHFTNRHMIIIWCLHNYAEGSRSTSVYNVADSHYSHIGIGLLQFCIMSVFTVFGYRLPILYIQYLYCHWNIVIWAPQCNENDYSDEVVPCCSASSEEVNRFELKCTQVSVEVRITSSIPCYSCYWMAYECSMWISHPVIFFNDNLFTACFQTRDMGVWCQPVCMPRTTQTMKQGRTVAVGTEMCV